MQLFWRLSCIIKVETKNERFTMKRAAIISAIFAAASLFISGCGVNDNYEYDNTPPAAPTGLVVYNGDGRVDVAWNDNRERDVAGYNVYFSFEYDGKYERIGSTTDNYFVDREAINGEKYYYAVTAYDYNGNESELSYEEVYAAPRPEGFDAAIDNSVYYENTSGFSFNTYSPVPYNTDNTDFFFTIDGDGRMYFDVYDDTYIRDMGATNNIYDIEFAPETFPNELYAQVVLGHTYVIWTWDNRFAKVRPKRVTGNRIVFDWAFQTREGEPMLKRGNIERKALDMEALNARLKERGIEIYKK